MDRSETHTVIRCGGQASSSTSHENHTHLPGARRSELVPAMRASLMAKIERLLRRPLIAQIEEGREDASGAYLVRIAIDYDERWRGREKEVHDIVSHTIEESITLLTDAERALLERSPRELLEQRPESVPLVDYACDGNRVIALVVASLPESRSYARHVAIVPNLVQLERQLDALERVSSAPDDGPLAPLRALVGLCDPERLARGTIDAKDQADDLDEHQRTCVSMAMATPHFAVIEGPPGSGKTKVITKIIERALARGERALVVSTTHVAIDNVVERLVAVDETKDDLAPHSLPIRYAARTKGRLPRALDYWVGPKRQRRAATISRRVQRKLTDAIPFAKALYEIEDPDAPGRPPLSVAMASVESVICGTPIGILSFEPVKIAEPATYDLLVVDEVSKMTLFEFLAVAVKARRWVLVGDPAQLPPYVDAEENAVTLDDVVPSIVELACSVAANIRTGERLAVVVKDPSVAIAVT